MRKQGGLWRKRILITILSLLGVVLLANLGINLWLKYRLPAFIQKKTEYQVKYEHLDVDLMTGDVSADHFAISTDAKAPAKTVKLSGTIDSLSIARLDLWNLFRSNELSTAGFRLYKPNLQIGLPPKKPKDSTKRQGPVTFDEMTILKGRIQIFNSEGQRYLGVSDLDVNVINLQMTEESLKKTIPVVFDQYKIKGRDFYFRADDVYEVSAGRLNTDGKSMEIRNFKMHPQLAFSDFINRFPKRRNLYDVQIDSIDFKDIKLDDGKFFLSSVVTRGAKGKIQLTDTPPAERQKDFNNDVELTDVQFLQSQIEVVKANGSRMFFGKQVDLLVKNFRINEETARGNIPFIYKDFTVKGRDLNYLSENQQFNVGQINITPKKIQAENILAKPISGVRAATDFDLSLKSLLANIDDWKLENGKFIAKIASLRTDALRGTIRKNFDASSSKKSSGIEDITIREIALNNNDIQYIAKGQPLHLSGLYLKTRNAAFGNRVKRQTGRAFQAGQYSGQFAALAYQTQYYNLKVGRTNLEPKQFSVENLNLTPRYSRSQYERMIPKQEDLYTVSAGRISGSGVQDFFGKNPVVNLNILKIDNLDANIFSSDVPPPNHAVKTFFSEKLRRIKFPLYVAQLQMNNSKLAYEEKAKKGSFPGKIFFENVHVLARNVHSGLRRRGSSVIPIKVMAKFMGHADLDADWTLNTASPTDAFTIKGTLNHLDVETLNTFVTPFLKIKADGQIQHLNFDFHGNRYGISGNQTLVFKDMKIMLLNKEGEERKVISAVLNWVIRDDSKSNQPIDIGTVKHEPERSFFNLFWHGIMEGLKKTLI